MYDYRYEPHHVVFMIDNKSFYASVESVARNLNPLQSVLVVMSTQPNTNGGLVLAASPMAKKKYGIKNVTRQRNLPSAREAPDLIKVNPRMNLYIQKNLEINKIFLEYAAEEDIHAYSIDESMIDMTKSWHLFANSPFNAARRIQREIRDKLGLYTTVGIGENPLLAKLALDIDAKHRISMIADWHYFEVPDTIWKIPNLENVWGINHSIKRRLEHLGIHNMKQLAHTQPSVLKGEFGIIGEQLFAMSWGVDRSVIRDKYLPRDKSYSNSQVLPRDYKKKREIEIVIREIVEQTAARIRHRQLQAGSIGLWIGFSYKASENNQRTGFSKRRKITPTNSNLVLRQIALALFEQNWHGETVRNIGIDYGNLVPDKTQQLNLFEAPERQWKQYQFDLAIDDIRRRYGVKSAVKLSSLASGGTAIQRAGLVGGHNGGNSYE